MENKYYTPEIEEFCVGVECEWQSKIRNETWNKQTSDTDLVSIAYDTIEHADEDESYEEQFRVKYLDGQDITDLGFKYTNNNLDLIKITDEKVIRIRLRIVDDIPHLRIYQTDEIFNKEQTFPIFVGKIKNRSELQKLLKQLEVI